MSQYKKWYATTFLWALLGYAAVNLLFLNLVFQQKPELTAQIITQSPSEKRQEGNWIWWVTRNYLVKHPDAEIALMGSSQMASASFAIESDSQNVNVDCVTDKNSRFLSQLVKERTGVDTHTCLFALGGAMISDQYIMAKTLFTQKHKPKLIVLGVNPRDFIDNLMPSCASTETFRFLSPYTDLSKFANYNFNSIFTRMDWTMNEMLPLKIMRNAVVQGIKSCGDNILSKSGFSVNDDQDLVANEDKPAGEEEGNGEAKGANATILDAIYGKLTEVKPATQIIHPGMTFDFMDNMREYGKRYKSPDVPMFAAQKKYFEELLTYCNEQNIKVVVVGMPNMWPNREILPKEFWTTFKAYVGETCNKYGAVFVDHLDDDKLFVTNDYIDCVHMNQHGGKKLLTSVADTIAKNQKVAQSLAAPNAVAERKSQSNL
ncbi:MAG: hypothetical protein SFY67_18675 [Candidatus Melainabacteria bacterium]|nr:hypothetical protein [Candidatus Melainabacteria bacterium]